MSYKPLLGIIIKGDAASISFSASGISIRYRSIPGTDWVPFMDEGTIKTKNPKCHLTSV
jgi:hypothetical protein